MMRFFRLLIITIVSFTAAFSIAAQDAKRIPVLVELFTSEGCSTCPPADKFLQKLVEQQPIDGLEIIGLSEHVDYWNRLGWTDPFSSAQFTNRQQYYAAFFKNAQIYTPQIVVDGATELIGGNEKKIFAQSANNPKGDVKLSVETQNETVVRLKISVNNLPEISAGDKAVILLAITENDLASNVSAGENNGKKLKHAAVARYLNDLAGVAAATTGEMTAETEVELKKDWKRENLNAVAFVQEANSRRILGVAKISLRK